MNYYKMKSVAFKAIEDLYLQGKDIKLIVYEISCQYGLGDKLILDRIEKIKQIKGEIHDNGNKI